MRCLDNVDHMEPGEWPGRASSVGVVKADAERCPDDAQACGLVVTEAADW
jgi:hypothetical protein